jgi:hypothetical protein
MAGVSFISAVFSKCLVQFSFFFCSKFFFFRLSEDAGTETLLGLLQYLNIGCRSNQSALSHPQTARLFNRKKKQIDLL